MLGMILTTLTLMMMIRTMMVTNGGDGDDNDNDDNDDGRGDDDGGYHIHQSVSAVHSAGEALSSLSGHNVDKLKQY